MSPSQLRIVVASVFTVAILLVIVPRHDWGVLAAALKRR